MFSGDLDHRCGQPRPQAETDDLQMDGIDELPRNAEAPAVAGVHAERSEVVDQVLGDTCSEVAPRLLRRPCDRFERGFAPEPFQPITGAQAARKDRRVALKWCQLVL